MLDALLPLGIYSPYNHLLFAWSYHVLERLELLVTRTSPWSFVQMGSDTPRRPRQSGNTSYSKGSLQASQPGKDGSLVETSAACQQSQDPAAPVSLGTTCLSAPGVTTLDKGISQGQVLASVPGQVRPES